MNVNTMNKANYMLSQLAPAKGQEEVSGGGVEKSEDSQQISNKEEIKSFLEQVTSLCDEMQPSKVKMIESTRRNRKIASVMNENSESCYEEHVEKTKLGAFNLSETIDTLELQEPNVIKQLKEALSEVISSYADMVNHYITHAIKTTTLNTSVQNVKKTALKISKESQLEDSQTALDNINIPRT